MYRQNFVSTIKLCYDNIYERVKGEIYVIVQEETWQEVPLLHVYDESMNEHSPTVIFLHGFTSAKEHNLHYAYQLVNKGIRVILPDAYLHGVRDKNMTEQEMSIHFWEIVIKSIKEVGRIYNELKEKKLAEQNKVAISGTSMGGITAAGCFKIYEWLNAAAICMGAPGYNDFANYQIALFEKNGVKLPLTEEKKEQIHKIIAEYDITKDPEKTRNRPVLFWHGQKDKVVPFNNAYDFYSQLRPYYEKTPEKLKFIVDPNEGHKVPRTGVLQVTDWLAQHLVY